MKAKYTKKLTDMQEVRGMFKSTLDKIGDELEAEYRETIENAKSATFSSGSVVDTKFIEENKGVIE